MKILLNAKEKEIQSTTISELLKELNLKTEGIAVALNYEVISKKNFDFAEIKDGDKVDVVKAVQGG